MIIIIMIIAITVIRTVKLQRNEEYQTTGTHKQSV